MVLAYILLSTLPFAPQALGGPQVSDLGPAWADVGEGPAAMTLSPCDEIATPDNKEGRRSLKKVPIKLWPAFTDDLGLDSLLAVLKSNVEYLSRFPPSRPVYFGERTSSIEELMKTMEMLRQVVSESKNTEDFHRRLKQHFDLYESLGQQRDGEVVFTGYYEAEVEASLSQGGPYQYPIYSRPPDLVAVDPSLGFDFGRRLPDGSYGPHFTREEISKGAISQSNLEMAWAKDEMETYMLQIQGSGWLRLDDGQDLSVGFNGANGWPYVNLYRKLKEKRIIPQEMSYPDAMEWLALQEPERKQELLNFNPRYVFFKIRSAGDSPCGASGVVLTPGRSVAADPRHFPLGALSFMITTRPVADESGRLIETAPLTRFAALQDTGSAIKGPSRVDIFWGRGPKARAESSGMKFPGRLYFFLIKQTNKKLASLTP